MAVTDRSGRQVDRPLSLLNSREQPFGTRAQTDDSSTNLGRHTMQTKHFESHPFVLLLVRVKQAAADATVEPDA